MILSGVQESGSLPFTGIRGFVPPSCAEGKIPAIKNPDKYLKKLYTGFP
jgi:hypothetical protein